MNQSQKTKKSVWVEAPAQVGLFLCLTTHNGEEDSRVEAIFQLLNQGDVDPETKQLKSIENLVCAEVPIADLTPKLMKIVEDNLQTYNENTIVCFRSFMKDENGNLIPTISDNVQDSSEENGKVT